jgi:hypothetical protein
VIADEEEDEGDGDHGALLTQRRQPVSRNGELLSRRGRSSPASAGGVDTHRDSTPRLCVHRQRLTGRRLALRSLPLGLQPTDKEYQQNPVTAEK